MERYNNGTLAMEITKSPLNMKIAVCCAAEIRKSGDWIKFSGAEKTVGYRAMELDRMGHDVTLYSLGPYKPEHGRLIHWTGDPKEIPVDEYEILDNNGSNEFPCTHVLNTINGPFWPKRNVVTISDSQAKGMGFWPNSRTAYYGTDIDYWKFREEKEDYIIYYSRVVHGKGCHIAIELAKELGFKLKIVGEDSSYVEPLYVAQIKQLCKDVPNIEWIGPKYEPENLEYVQKAKALLFPQFWGEAFGLVQIESLACGTPVIAGGRNGAPPEIIKHGETGFLVYDFDPPYNDIREAIKNIDKIDHKACRKDAEERWSSKVMAERYLTLFREVISGVNW